MTLRPRERRAIDLLAAHPNWTNKEIAAAMGIKPRVVHNYLLAVFAFYDAPNRTVARDRHLAAQRRRRPAVAEGQLELA